MAEGLLSTLVILLGGGWLGLSRRYAADELTLLFLSFVLHLVAAWGQVWATESIYGGGDLLGYYHSGTLLARALQADFWTFFPEVVKLISHQPAQLPVSVLLAGTSSGAMAGVSACVLYVLGGSLTTACLFVAVLGFHTKRLVYDILKTKLHPDYHRMALVSLTMIPSVVYWSAALLKESMAMVGLACAIYGVSRLRAAPWAGGAQLLVGVALTAALKSYLLVPFAAACVTWLYWRRAVVADERGARLRRPWLALAGLLCTAGAIVGAGSIFPELSLASFAEQAEQLQFLGEHVTGGSSYVLADSASGTFLGQITFAPAALLTALFRPTLLEVTNLQMAANAVENTVLLVLSIYAPFRHARRVLWQRVISNPEMVFCAVFFVILGIAVGLTSTNLGTLSRYRAPLMPCFALFVLVVAGRGARSASAVHSSCQAAPTPT